MKKLPDSGLREVSATGALKEVKKGCGRYDLISTEGLRRLALRYEGGAEKYGERNWEKGGSWGGCFSSLIRHAFQWITGDVTEDHLAAVAWWAFCLMEYEKTYKEGCNISALKVKRRK